MFRRTKIGTAAMLALGGSLGLAMSPSVAQDTTTQRVEITGSAIKRIDAETAVPVTVLKADELKGQGITTVEQILSVVSAVQMTQSTSQVVGSGSGGASFADLRGIGANKTLVLLNGRRIANNAYDSSAPDLNMIPFAAIERVEVLRDGASALYGTDAVGGVINFITRKDFTGGSITLGADRPESPGGESVQGNVGFGFGDLGQNGFNVFGFVDFSKTDRIGGTERPFNARQPGGLSPTPFPANYYQDGTVVGNPAGPDCADPSFLIPVGDGSSCYIATAAFVNYTPKAERTSVMLRGTLALGSEHSLSLEWFGSQNKTESVIAPVPYGTLWMNRLRPDGTPNPYYPGNSGSGFTPSFPLDPNFTQPNMTPRPGVTLQPGFVVVKWRDLATGSRTDSTDNKQQRFVAQVEGAFSGWDYQAGASFNENKVKQMISGYSDGDRITQGMLNGIINPFGPQDSAGEAFIAASELAGNLQNARGRVTGLDGKISRELGDWLGVGRKSALAVGFEARKEDFWQAANTPFARLVQASTGIDPESVSEGERNVTAIYAELSVPLMKQLEATVALRHDRYSDFGSTTNPKFTLRYEPLDSLLLRATYGTGFRAPSLYEINAVPYFTNTGTIDDPVNCPNGTTAIPGKSTALNCNVQFQALYGGNSSLQPEKSKNWTLGMVFEPTRDINIGLDFWWVNLTNQIGSLSEYTVVENPDTFAGNFHRNASGDLSIDGFACPGSDCGYIDLRTQNLGDLRSSGVDLSVGYRLRLDQTGSLRLGLNSTYVSKYEYQDYTNGPWNQNVGVFVGSGPIFRWQHSATAMWNVSAWTLGWAGHYKSGYVDQDPSNSVSSYFTMDAYMSWKPSIAKGVTLTAGITNFADRDPPYSNQDQVFQANYDPRFTDPTGRKYYVRASYQF
ncbi:MAG: TonB-dependent receptor [Pseudomonadota bacterium]